MTFLSLFSGIGGLDLGLERAGLRCIGQVEIDPFCRRVLAKHWPNVPKWGDIREFTGNELTEKPDLICGGFPCQDISLAGKGAGLAGERSGLWYEFLRLIRDLQPRFVLLENVAALLVRGFGTVLAGLVEIGFDAEWSIVPACALGAPHSRERVFCIAYPNEVGHGSRFNFNGASPRFDDWKATQGKSKWGDVELWLRQTFQVGHRESPDSATAGILDGVSEELDDAASDAYGNAVVPQVAEFIGRAIMVAHAESERAA